ncbi:leucyl aminopeptidase family protein [Marivibrio halodurans]|uniref:Leucyl aminopeptidase family protein n=1 Tax=Marivibrio halodurans TaxID=2039722 RepID=A0A8J7V426_9PROT|nr:leucyl aminopeptidase family protein [Marivibrio halodurans]MBP5858642.1 leucyl aminopeptidase family protein [Marivibrio halodurans]
MADLECFAARADKKTLALVPLDKKTLADWRAGAGAAHDAWVARAGFTAKAGAVLLLPGAGGEPEAALLGVEGATDHWSWGAAAAALPEGRYRLSGDGVAVDPTGAALGWALGSYRFTRYRKSEESLRELVWPDGADKAAVDSIARAVHLARDLINTPAGDMGPGELANEARALARAFKGQCDITVGDDLLRDNFPMIHAVGRASSRAPRLIDLTWGRAGDPKITIVGKGVCFDTGGLDLKPSGAMLMMKKDMGGAAQALAVARMVMAAELPVRLRVLIPAVENSVSGDAFRPMDVLPSRKGLTVEIGNTDAEGRLVLADALALACEEEPEMLMDFATLTGAARVALGTEVPALFCNDDVLADALADCAAAVRDPLWRMPLVDDYDSQLDSKVADLNNAPPGGYGGAITAALFLRRFVDPGIPWFHIDVMAWNTKTKPGRPEGGEAQSPRAVFEMLRRRYG